ncbi:MAG: hypothetical protein U5L11_02545 [Arhodomonas sp.]|nr:hypothetical protein [Arhodomonas sp.]
MLGIKFAAGAGAVSAAVAASAGLYIYIDHLQGQLAEQASIITEFVGANERLAQAAHDAAQRARRTDAALADRERANTALADRLRAMKGELTDAYAHAQDACADVRPPGPVLELLHRRPAAARGVRTHPPDTTGPLDGTATDARPPD